MAAAEPRTCGQLRTSHRGPMQRMHAGLVFNRCNPSYDNTMTLTAPAVEAGLGGSPPKPLRETQVPGTRDGAAA